MKDVFGNELKVGDKVVFVDGANNSSRLAKGTVKKIYSNDKECTVDSKSHVLSFRVMKLD